MSLSARSMPRLPGHIAAADAHTPGFKVAPSSRSMVMMQGNISVPSAALARADRSLHSQQLSAQQSLGSFSSYQSPQMVKAGSIGKVPTAQVLRAGTGSRNHDDEPGVADEPGNRSQVSRHNLVPCI